MGTYSKPLWLIWPEPNGRGDENKRHATRQPAGLHARLAYGGLNAGLQGCELLDLSASGVRVETAAPLDDVPELLSLEFAGALYRVRRCWTRGREIGLEFVADNVQAIDDK